MLVRRQHAGDVEGMVALYEPDAIVDVGEGRVFQGIEVVRIYFAKVVASSHKYTVGEQQPPRICGDFALTSTPNSRWRGDGGGGPPPSRRELALGDRHLHDRLVRRRAQSLSGGRSGWLAVSVHSRVPGARCCHARG
jgi:hypothetical protein